MTLRILEKLRENVPRAVDLLEEEMPGTGQFGIALQLIPAALGGRTDGLEESGLPPHVRLLLRFKPLTFELQGSAILRHRAHDVVRCA
jgi:hypothetical protein